jgi:hypothetical protein
MCKCWIQMIRTILFLVALDAVWTCREIKTFQRNTLSPSSVNFGSEHKDIIFLRIDGIDLQAHSVNTQNNTVVFTAGRTPSVTVYNFYFPRKANFIRSLEKPIPFGQVIEPGPGAQKIVMNLVRTWQSMKPKGSYQSFYRVKIFSKSPVKYTVSRSHEIYVHS